MRIDLSEQSIDALADIISGGSAGANEPSVGLYRQGWRLEGWFKNFGVRFELQGATRVTATANAIRSAIFLDSGDAELLRRIIEAAADPRDFIKEPERHAAVIDYLNRHFILDGLKLEQAGRKIQLVEIAETANVTIQLSAMAARIDFDTVVAT